MVAEKGIPDMRQRRRSDGAATSLGWRWDVAPTALGRRSDGAATSLQWRSDGAATSLDVAVMLRVRDIIL